MLCVEWLLLKERRADQKLCLLLKMSHGLMPPYLIAALPVQRAQLIGGYDLPRTRYG